MSSGDKGHPSGGLSVKLVPAAAVSTRLSRARSLAGIRRCERLHDVASGILLVPLPGHSRGHAAYAIEIGERWLLHVGDASYHHSTLEGGGRPPLLLRLQESIITFDRRVMRMNQQRLFEMQQLGSPNLEIVNAHSPVLYQRSFTGR